MTRPVFDCKRCNECCTGEGGIYLEMSQASGAAAEIGLSREVFIANYCREQEGRLAILCNEAGYCSLLGPRGCLIHQNKPAICRRWPFFAALLKDAGAFEEAKLACPGIRPDASHEEFVASAQAQGYQA